MPTYDFICDQCGHVEEITCPMDEITDAEVVCPRCPPAPCDLIDITKPKGMKQVAPVLMRRIYSPAGAIFKGGAPGQDLKRQKEDSDIQRQRRKACVLKDQGDVPQAHVLGLKESDRRYDRKYTEGQLDKLYQESTLHRPKKRPLDE